MGAIRSSSPSKPRICSWRGRHDLIDKSSRISFSWAAIRLIPLKGRPKEVLFSRREVAKLLNLSERQITRLIANEKLDIIRIGART